MALLLRYLKDGKPIERLVEYILCESITGVALCEDIQRTLSGLNLEFQNTVSQTYDGATNFSGQIKGCAALFQQTVPYATYLHCSDHDLNLALCHTCKDIPEIRNMLSCVTEVGLFFKYSQKGHMSSVHCDNIFQFFEWALPSPHTFNQELDV